MNIRATIFDRERPLIVTLIAAITAAFAAYRLLHLIVLLAQYPRYISIFDFVGPLVSLALSYFLLRGKNWTRLLFAFLSILSALLITIANINNTFTLCGAIAIIYLLFVFCALTLNQKAVSYFKKQKGVQQGVAGYPPQGVGSPER